MLPCSLRARQRWFQASRSCRDLRARSLMPVVMPTGIPNWLPAQARSTSAGYRVGRDFSTGSCSSLTGWRIVRPFVTPRWRCGRVRSRRSSPVESFRISTCMVLQHCLAGFAQDTGRHAISPAGVTASVYSSQQGRSYCRHTRTGVTVGAPDRDLEVPALLLAGFAQGGRRYAPCPWPRWPTSPKQSDGPAVTKGERKARACGSSLCS